MRGSHTRRHEKLEISDREQLGPATRALQDYLDSPPFLAFLSAVTGVEELLADEMHYAAGVHETPQGGRTMVHRDFAHHPVTRLHHRVNVLVYLNPGWQDDWGGQLELWRADMSELGARIQPLFNTMVVWETHAGTPHGLPEPDRGAARHQPSRARVVLLHGKGRPGTDASEDARRHVPGAARGLAVDRSAAAARHRSPLATGGPPASGLAAAGRVALLRVPRPRGGTPRGLWHGWIEAQSRQGIDIVIYAPELRAQLTGFGAGRRSAGRRRSRPVRQRREQQHGGRGAAHIGSRRSGQRADSDRRIACSRGRRRAARRRERADAARSHREVGAGRLVLKWPTWEPEGLTTP